MTYTPVAHADSLRIGTVEFVAPDEVKALLDIEAPDSVALNAGGVQPFPRVNGYVLMPVDGAFLVGQIEWITVERSQFPKRRGVQDFGLIDLPYPLRRVKLAPLGTLSPSTNDPTAFVFQRGADALPTIGTPVQLPTRVQLRSIVESGAQRRVRLGVSPLAANAEVKVDPDRLYGRHLAVLGNTGSGKSCSVAGLIRWSIEAAAASRTDGAPPDARFIVLDPNGEYARAFGGDGEQLHTRIYRADASDASDALRVPLWFWTSSEWSAIAQASSRTQRPLLKRALREVKAGRGAEPDANAARRLGLRRYLSSCLITMRHDLISGGIRSDETKFGYRLKAIRQDLLLRSASMPECKLDVVIGAIDGALGATSNTFQEKTTGKTIEYFRAFTEGQVEAIVDAMVASLGLVGGLVYTTGPSEDCPVPFSGSDLADHLELLAAQENVSQWVDVFVARIRSLLAEERINALVETSTGDALAEWLADYIGSGGGEAPHLAILDLSLVPSEVVHIVAAVAARMVFEALQRYRRMNGAVLPTVVVMEEAHTFIKRYKDDIENPDMAAVCCQVFERIAREGRKFGLGLVLSSQRPSELSQTVLSQCNTFLLHRLNNDRDQEMVHRLLPDSLHGLLRELPSLPSQYAVLLGWASQLPVLVRIDDLPRHQRPQSDDPDFWAVWTGSSPDGAAVSRTVDWGAIAKEWQGREDDDEEEG